MGSLRDAVLRTPPKTQICLADSAALLEACRAHEAAFEDGTFMTPTDRVR